MSWWRRTSRDSDLQREIESHLEAEAGEQRENGVAAANAANAARRLFGNLTLVQEVCLEVLTSAGLLLARGLFPGRSPLSQHIVIGQRSMEVVGVAKDTRYQSLREPAQPMVYRPYLQMPETSEELFFGIRTTGDPERIVGLVKRALRETAPNVPVFSLSTLEARVDATLTQERMVSALSTWFGAFALLLSAIGLYGRLAYAVVERTREIGIRLALGAARTVVMWTILRQVLALVSIGIAIGLPLSMLSARAIQTLLFGLAPFDPRTLGVVAAVILGTAFLAGCIPACRAARVDPMVALRYE